MAESLAHSERAAAVSLAFRSHGLIGMRWMMYLLLVPVSVACNRTPSGEPQAADKRPPSASAPADWARRDGYDTGAPPLQRRDEAGQPAASARAPQRQ